MIDFILLHPPVLMVLLVFLGVWAILMILMPIYVRKIYWKLDKTNQTLALIAYHLERSNKK